MPGPARLTPILIISFLYSLGTAVLWNGLAFVAKEHYAFSEAANLGLAIFNGALYAIGAFASGPLLRRFSTLTPRRFVAIVLAIQALLCPIVLITSSAAMLLLVTGSMSLLAAFFWPIIESYLSAGRDPRRMRQAIGWWNIVWMSALGLGLVAMAPLLAAGEAQWSIALLAPINLLCICVLLLGFPARIAPHREAQPNHDPPTTYRHLLASSRALLPTSYALMGALSPIMPYVLSNLDAPLAWQTPLTATWMFARVLGVGLLWALPFWHGRFGAILAGAILLLAGFALTVVSPQLWMVVLGLAFFGFGHAVIYYGAFYYVMAVGDADVHAAGSHEGLIGVGYGAGPAAALVGVLVGGGGWIVATTFFVPVLAILPAARPYLAARTQAARKRPS